MSEYMHVTEYRKLVKAGKIKAHRPKKKGEGSKAKAEIEMMLKLAGIEYETETKFHPKRKWRFDYTIKGHLIAIEFEGIMSEKSRHTTVTGYSKDTEKYNAAAAMGYTVLRYTVLTYTKLIDELKPLL